VLYLSWIRPSGLCGMNSFLNLGIIMIMTILIVKVKLSLRLIKYHAMKTYWGE
jgi:hypothetical protein